MLLLLQNPPPVVVTLVPKPTNQVNIGDVLVGSLGLAGVLLVGAAVLGAIVAVGMVVWKKWHPPEADHLPSITHLG
jgi:hypothetical protein